jgi:hypothetical protein
MTIDEGALRLTCLQSEIRNLDSTSKPSDTIKTETLLASLGLEYKPILAELDTSGSTVYNDIIIKLKKAEARLKTGLQGQNLARLTSIKNQGSFNRNRLKKRAYYYCSKSEHFKREYKKL